MKKRKLQRVVALALTLCLCLSLAMPVSAAGRSSSAGTSWNSIWDRLVSRIKNVIPTAPETPAEPEEPEETPEETPAEPEEPAKTPEETPEETPAETPEVGSSGELTLVEDETTVEEGTELRASTYALHSNSKSGGASTYAASGTTLKYFPVTMYNYDKTTINNATHQVEVDNDLSNTWNGIYFSDGSPAAESYSEGIALEDGTYIIQNARAEENNVGSWLVGNTSGITSTKKQSDATRWTVKSNGDGTYTLNSANGYMTIGSGENGDKTAATASAIEIVGYTGRTYTNCVQLKSGSYYLCQWSSNTATSYGGYDENNDAGNAFYFYKVTDSGTKKVTFTTTTTDRLPFAAWNWWNKGETGNDKDNYGQYTYSGLVESTLTANKDITFTKPDGGIFNSDATVKKIYTGVEMPFVYENDTYTFDASQNGVYFHEDSDQGSTVAQSNGRLYFDKGKTQGWSNIKFGDGSKTVWAPFDEGTSLSGSGYTGNIDYHFGMRTTIPFTMTANGKINPNNNESKDITFSFSGDDDVWIFIDGQLIIDLGGIHNRLDATINFAQNTWSISESNTSDVEVADYNHAAISGKVFNDGNATGTLNQTRETFAATDSHELTIFYLERGAGSSNCKIQFNLPMKDTLSVKKLVRDTDSAGLALDAETLAQINNRDFGFTLYKDGSQVANVNYSLLNENGQYISTPSTDANGHFTLKNGQTAKFVGEINTNSYYVVEDKDADADDFWLVPEWSYTAEVANRVTSIDSTTNGQSMTVTATGSSEAEDSIVFTCTNIWKHQNNTSISAVDDKIVIDYGLPVVIDVLANDTVSNGTKSIESVTGAQYGTATIENGKIKYQLDQQLTGVEVLTYTVKATASSGVESDNKTATAKVYIIPATSMYYEENFTGLVNFSDGWTGVGNAQTDPQEPGVVGTVGDSPYGSDAAYLNDSGDSNGSSKYVDTTAGPASFSYTFTGTGTTFFARTNNNSGYMRVVITDAAGSTVYTAYRDTSYKNSEGTIGGDVNVTGGVLYNIPVFTYKAENYGTYTVTVSIAGGANAKNYGKAFWLDGIRVISPLNSADDNASVANSAYATDGEANMTVVTLREKIIADYTVDGETGDIVWIGDGFVLFTDTNGNIVTASEYQSNGPKEEVYLDNTQSVTFSLTKWDPNTNKIYLGVKAPVGNGTVSINGNTLNINNAADCYYDISGYANITTDEKGVKTATFKVEATSSLISVTNIKVTGNAEFTIVNEENRDVNGSEGEDPNVG